MMYYLHAAPEDAADLDLALEHCGMIGAGADGFPTVVSTAGYAVVSVSHPTPGAHVNVMSLDGRDLPTILYPFLIDAPATPFHTFTGY